MIPFNHIFFTSILGSELLVHITIHPHYISNRHKDRASHCRVRASTRRQSFCAAIRSHLPWSALGWSLSSNSLLWLHFPTSSRAFNINEHLLQAVDSVFSWLGCWLDARSIICPLNEKPLLLFFDTLRQLLQHTISSSDSNLIRQSVLMYTFRKQLPLIFHPVSFLSFSLSTHWLNPINILLQSTLGAFTFSFSTHLTPPLISYSLTSAWARSPSVSYSNQKYCNTATSPRYSHIPLVRHRLPQVQDVKHFMNSR